jgi:hypothetical protein
MGEQAKTQTLRAIAVTPHLLQELLQYRNPGFAIHQLIADCPAATVVRELVKNAEENTIQLRPPGRIEWFVEPVQGVPKLGVYNEGPGMAGDELASFMDLASTGKTLGVDNNFGQGGKISALKVSPHGVVYRSCHRGQVSQLILAAEPRPEFDYPVYVKRMQPSAVAPARRPLDRDWTEVVLLGRNAAHDTVSDLLPEARAKNWLIRQINTRFYRFPAGVIVHAANVTTDAQETRNACGLERLTHNHAARQEDVAAVHPRFGPVVVRYTQLRGQYGEDEAGTNRAKTMEAYGINTRGDHIALVWKDECYDVHLGWCRISGAFGFTFGSSNVAVHILLPDAAPVKNNVYRSAILDRSAEQQPIRVEAFADLVQSHRPAWLVRYIEREARKHTNGSGVMKRLKAFWDELKGPGGKRAALKPGGQDEGELLCPRRGGRTRGGSLVEPSAPRAAPKRTRPGRGRALSKQLPGVPTISFAEDPALLEEMVGCAALYRHEGNALLLNPRHAQYLQDLEKVYADVGPSSDRRLLAKKVFDEEYFTNAGKFVIRAWSFGGQPAWNDRGWEEALNPKALTVFLALPASLDEARRRLRQKLNSRKLEAHYAE